MHRPGTQGRVVALHASVLNVMPRWHIGAIPDYEALYDCLVASFDEVLAFAD